MRIRCCVPLPNYLTSCSLSMDETQPHNFAELSASGLAIPGAAAFPLTAAASKAVQTTAAHVKGGTLEPTHLSSTKC